MKRPACPRCAGGLVGLLQRALPMADARDQAALEQALADARARVGA